jgi:hypothetical protein
MSRPHRVPDTRGLPRDRGARVRVAVGGAATAILAALCLTACGDGGDSAKASPGSSPAASPSASATGTPSAPADSPSSSPSSSGSGTAGGTAGTTTARPAASTGSVSGKGSGTTAGRTGTSPATGARSSSGKPVTCEGSVTRTVAAPVTRPVNHLLLTVTNTGSRTCFLYGYPALQFPGSQSVPPPVEDSQPQAVVTLDPGESGYASVRLSAGDGSGTHGRTEHSLTVYFSGRSGSGSVGAGARPTLPAKGVYVDDSLTTTYWQQYADDALNW